MITNLVMTRFRHLLITVAALIKRILCCCSRRRKGSTCEGADAALNSVDVVRDSGARYKQNVVEKDWNSWDDSPKTVEEHIERYREQLAAPPPPREPPPEEQIDFFQDMAPKTFSQPKVYIAEDGPQDDPSGSQFSRLTAQIDIPVEDGLTDWNDDGPRAGWDDADENTTKQLIRETRKELRQQRQMQHHHHQQQQQQHRGYYK